MKEIRYFTRTRSATSPPSGKMTFRTTARRLWPRVGTTETFSKTGTILAIKPSWTRTRAGTILVGSKPLETGTFPEVFVHTFP